MVVGKDSRTYPATLEPGKTHALAVAALRRQPCLSCARTDYADKYAVSIRSILTLPINSYLFQLTDLFFFLGRCLLCILSLFSLSSTSIYLLPAKTRDSILTLYNNSTYDVQRSSIRKHCTKIAVLRIVRARVPYLSRCTGYRLEICYEGSYIGQ